MTYDPLTSTAGPDALYTAFFEALSSKSYLMKADPPRYTILAVTEQHLQLTGLQKKDMIGKSVFEVFPPNVNEPSDTGGRDFLASLQYVVSNKAPHYLPSQRYDITDNEGRYREKYWKTENKPVFSPGGGEVAYIIHTTEDISDQVTLPRQSGATKGMENAYHFFMNAPVIIGILRGDAYVIELANEGLLEVWGKTDDVIGKPLLTAIPELETQGLIALLDQVRYTGEPYYAYEFPITLNRNGREEVLYFDFVYKPFYEPDAGSMAAGIISVGHDVTSQVVARKFAQESDSKYRNLFESMDQGFCLLEMIFEDGQPTDYRFLEVNPVFEKQTGLVDATGKTARELVPNLEAHWLELYGKVALSGESVRFTEGSEAMRRWFDVFAFRVGAENSHKVALLFTDITERKRAEEALLQSEENLRNVILQSPVAMAILKGPQFVVELANAPMYELWGRGKNDLIGKSIFEGMPEVRDQGYEELLKGVFTTGKRFTALGKPVTLPRAHGIETVYINFLYEPFREADGSISGVMAVATDVTAQVEAKLKIEESNKEFQFVTDFMPQLIWVARPDGSYYYYNKQWYDYTGLTHGETEGEGWNNVIHPGDQQRAGELWRHSLETGEPYEIEYRFRRYDGDFRWFLGRALPLKDEEGKILKWFGTCTDIDDQKKAAEIMEQRIEERTRELQRSNQELSRSNQNLEEFAYAASHDLKEPMRKIQLFSDRLKTTLQEKLSSQDSGMFDRIIHATNRMNTLIDDLLMYSNVSRGAVLEETIDLNQKLSRVLEDLEVEIEEKKALIVVDPLPVVKGHRRQMQQLFQNLIGNAIKYHKPGMPPEVHISCRRLGPSEQILITTERPPGQYNLIEVRDNGIGFEQEDADRIFKIFTRLHGNAEYSGTGVGLSIVKKVVENHNGYIWAESSPGKGAAFKILLPAE
ncbi:MAG: PAS domain S-box protein [Chitinophagaceae bacterium]|nr:MAG: PAS domain S-box protein [Chitinophagaceae bacterium]